MCLTGCYGRHNIPENRYTTSCLQILLHGVISLPDATSFDNNKNTMGAKTNNE